MRLLTFRTISSMGRVASAAAAGAPLGHERGTPEGAERRARKAAKAAAVKGARRAAPTAAAKGTRREERTASRYIQGDPSRCSQRCLDIKIMMCFCIALYTKMDLLIGSQHNLENNMI